MSLLCILMGLIFLSAFFSSAETGLMSLNRYRLRHQAKEGKKSAIKASQLLERPDRLLSVILIGNTFANVMASSIATVMLVRLFGDYGVALATIFVTFMLLIFAEIAPKTVAALYPSKIADFACYPLAFLLKFLSPIVWLSNKVVNNFLRLFGIVVTKAMVDHLSMDELRTVVLESSGRISQQHQDMLLRILEMEEVTVDDVMIPRSDIIGIDIEASWEDILRQLTCSPHTKLPLYRDDIDNVVGIVHLRDALKLLGEDKLNKTSLAEIARDVYFIPEGTALTKQLLNFKKEQHRNGLVVDEYGDILGLVTLEDILEEIVGEFTTEIPSIWKSVQTLSDNSYEVDGSVNIRELNRIMRWDLPVDGPKTLGGLLTEYFEEIPQRGICMRINGYPVEILEMEGNLVKTVKISPNLRNVA
jgi:Mg2+/Co2+ transporter CorB